MRTYRSNQEFYDHIDEVVELLRTVGHEKSADKINHLLHKVAWTTSSELFGELRDEFSAIIQSKTELPVEIHNAVKGFIETINTAWDR